MTALLVGIVRGGYRDVENHEMPEEAREVELVSLVADMPRCAPEPISDAQWADLCRSHAITPREEPAPSWLRSAS